MEEESKFRPVLVDLNHLNQLRRDWEAAFTIQLHNGRYSEHLQQLLHTQFSFLENVVLNLSNQAHSLQEQLTVERNANEKLVEKLNVSRSETKDLVSSLVKRIEELERSRYSYQAPMKELIGEFGTVKSKLDVQNSQIISLQEAMSMQGTAIQSTITHQADIKNEESVNIQKINSEMELIKKTIEEDRESRKVETIRLSETLSAANAANKQNETFILQISKDVGSLSTKLDKQLSMIRQEQNTVLSVIKTISGSISNLRLEFHVHDSKQSVKIETVKQSILQQMKSDIKSVSRPLIIS
jgi:chromosome segregation ATPase